jgi:outer membrane protein assembly factor BamB
MSLRNLVLLACFIAACPPLSAQTPAYWPQFRRPDRSNVAKNTGLLKKWPEEGPPLVWKVTDWGAGMAPVSVAEGRICLSPLPAYFL